MKKPNQDDEPFFITEEIAAEMIAGGYEFELPPIPCTIRLRDVLERMTDAELYQRYKLKLSLQFKIKKMATKML
ncbi:hypothetical protein CV951_019655, partial [Acinetobacter baumannii]|uniref:hypothetical protein n=1 Tax=Acinetobacter baumannii TaxID=470 RepID=UPI000D268622